MDHRRRTKTARFAPWLAVLLWHLSAAAGFSQVQEARAWIEGMT